MLYSSKRLHDRLLLRGKHDNHTFPFKYGHLFHFSEFFQIICKTEQQHLALLFEQDGTAFEKHIRLYFRPFLKEALRMFELEVIVVIVGLRSETYLFHHDFCSLRFLLFKAFLLLIEEF